MSVLSFPRIYVRGYMCWNPATGNNNDYVNTYAAGSAALNYAFLETQDPPISPLNYRATFRNWATGVETQPGSGYPYIPGEWNYFGSHATYFVDYQDKVSGVTGGVLRNGQPASSDDPLLQSPIQLEGDIFGDTPSEARLVDNNPVATWTSQIFFKRLLVGKGDIAIKGDCQYRMHSRWFNPQRNTFLSSAGVASVIWQTAISREAVTITNTGNSPLLAALDAAMAAPGAKGLMLRFCVYYSLYNQNGIFNDFKPEFRLPLGTKPDSPEMRKYLDEMSAAYRQALSGEIPLFSNPCYSTLVGAIGVWNEGELATVPTGRFLSPARYAIPASSTALSATPQPSPRLATVRGSGGGATAASTPFLVGPAVAEADYSRNLLSIDLSDATPEANENKDKVDFGPLTVGVVKDGAFTAIGTVAYAGAPGVPIYSKDAYEASAGIVDLPFEPDVAGLLREGQLVVRQNDVAILTEKTLTAETDDRNIYIDQYDKAGIAIAVYRKGKPVEKGVRVMVVQYRYVNWAAYLVSPQDSEAPVQFVSGSVQTVPSRDPGLSAQVTVVETDDRGIATAEVQASYWGFATCFFYPLEADEPLPVPFAVPGGQYDPKHPEQDNYQTSHFANIRVMPFDDDMPAQFAKLWNDSFDSALAWQYIYNGILGVYDMLFPVMDDYMPLGERSRVEAAINQLLVLTQEPYQDASTLYMPITRDLSSGKRRVLEMWGSLVRRQYPHEPIQP